MRVLGFWVLFGLFGAAMLLAFSSSSFSDLVFLGHGETAPAMVTIRKLKENNFDVSSTMKKRNLVNFNVEDYPTGDPSPSSKATIKYGPIEHGSPLMPYPSNPTPPIPPKHGGSP